MYEKTFVLLKPDALERRLVGRIIQRYEDAGLEILDIHFHKRVSKDLIRKHYPDSMALAIANKAQKTIDGIKDLEAYGRNVLQWLHQYVTRAPVIAVKIGGENAIRTVRKVTGFTDPSTADKGTIRGDFGIDSLKKSTDEMRACENLIHASGNEEEAKAELSLWFPE